MDRHGSISGLNGGSRLLLVARLTCSNLLPPFQAQARVIRVDPQGDNYRLGVEFLSIA